MDSARSSAKEKEWELCSIEQKFVENWRVSGVELIDDRWLMPLDAIKPGYFLNEKIGAGRGKQWEQR